MQYNLRELSFNLKPSEIKSIEWYDYKNHSNNRTWQWIRIICEEYVLNGDFLISVEGKSNTRRLFEMLNQFKDGSEITTSLKDYFNIKTILLGYIGFILLMLSSFLYLTFNMLYGTINGNIGGPLSVIIMLLGFMFYFSFMGWVFTKGKENSKITPYFWIIMTLFFIWVLITNLINSFYP